MQKLTLAIAAFAVLLGMAVAHADSFPSHPITLMVGFPPGGPTDALARLLAKGMGDKLGQTIVVETVSGASGTIATGRVVHAAPDGYTIGIGNWSSHVGSPQIYKLDYDIQTDLAPISLLAYSPLLILGKDAIPPNTAKELIAWLKAKNRPPRSVPSAPAVPRSSERCRLPKPSASNSITCRIAAPARRSRT
jgi:tripartite-type tricarboxylate transporter receptor subunit TctC